MLIGNRAFGGRRAESAGERRADVRAGGSKERIVKPASETGKLLPGCYCGREFKRKLEQGPVDHEVEFKCKVYENGRVAAGPETLRRLANFSERQISKRTGVHRNTIRLVRHGKCVKRSTYEKVINFLRENAIRTVQA